MQRTGTLTEQQAVVKGQENALQMHDNYADHTLSWLMISDDNKMINGHAPSYLYDLLKP